MDLRRTGVPGRPTGQPLHGMAGATGIPKHVNARRTPANSPLVTDSIDRERTTARDSRGRKLQILIPAKTLIAQFCGITIPTLIPH